MSELRDVFGAILDAQNKGEKSVLCTVFTSSGSVPRRSGSRMLVREDGSFAGTVGGGPGEANSLLHAAEIISGKADAADIQSFELIQDKPGSIGICGGRFQILFQLLSPGDSHVKKLAQTVLECDKDNIRTWMVTVRRGGTFTTLYVDGRGLLDDVVPEDEVKDLLKGTAKFSPGLDIYTEPLIDGSNVYIFGGGHVSKETVKLLSNVGFSVVVYENRPEYATAERFPDAAGIVLAPYEELRSHVQPSAADYAIIMTRGDGDETCIRELLKTEAGHIGCIGSRKKLAVFRTRLAESGYSEEDIARVHNPIGLSIGSETPAEIAVSVAAEMIMLRAQKRKE